MFPELSPYELPPDLLQAILELASQSDVLLFGECYGTQEVPRLLLGLLDALSPIGYAGLSLQLPCNQRAVLERYAWNQVSDVPDFFTQPWNDGRGNCEVLTLIKQGLSIRRHWRLLCFDQAIDQPASYWSDQDGWMAQHLTEQWMQLCPTAKLVGVCDNLHSRIVRTIRKDEISTYWPSFAHQLQLQHIDRTICTINIRFRSGSFFNVKQNTISNFGLKILPTPKKPTLRLAKEHTYELTLPYATPVTFLSPPSPPSLVSSLASKSR